VFAIGEFIRDNESGALVVNGGTGWAVQMSIDNKKPVHVYDLNQKGWYTYNYETNSWENEETPKLTKNFAGIGTRSIDPYIEEKTKGKVKYVGDETRAAVLGAMNSVFEKTFGKKKDAVDKLKTVQEETSTVLGGGFEAINAIANSLSVAVEGVSLEDALAGQ
jgi:hypothetical protein